MGQHHREGIKGDGYKAAQRTQPRQLRMKPANITEKWMVKHGWVKGEDGKWSKR